jgi:hypothetical protein
MSLIQHRLSCRGGRPPTGSPVVDDPGGAFRHRRLDLKLRLECRCPLSRFALSCFPGPQDTSAQDVALARCLSHRFYLGVFFFGFGATFNSPRPLPLLVPITRSRLSTPRNSKDSVRRQDLSAFQKARLCILYFRLSGTRRRPLFCYHHFASRTLA